MGTFRVTLEIARQEEGPFQQVDALVDTGAFHTWLPESVLEGLGIQRTLRRSFLLADVRAIEHDVSVVVARLDGQTLPTLAIFGDEGAELILGAYTLEGFALAQALINRRLVPLPRLYLV